MPMFPEMFPLLVASKHYRIMFAQRPLTALALYQL